MTRTARRAKKSPRRKLSPVEKFGKLQNEMNDRLRERAAEVRGLLLALLAREHVLLLGPHGTAKSLATELLSNAIEGDYFYYLMSKFTQPEELFGPFSIQGIKNDTFVRVIDDQLPEAEVAFLDECFKANSSILNSLLTLLNERRYHNGGAGIVDCPLQTCVGASNELPEDKSLDALYDRFMLRFWTGPIKSRDEMKLMLTSSIDPLSVTIESGDLQAAQTETEEVELPDEVIETLLNVKAAIEKAGFKASDRRWKKSLRILRAVAWLDGRTAVEEEDLLILSDVLWWQPKDRNTLAEIIARVASPVAAEATEILDACVDTYNKLPIGNDIPESESARVFAQIVESNAQFKNAIKRLEKLGKGKANSRVDSAVARITEMATEAGRFAQKVSGLNFD